MGDSTRPFTNYSNKTSAEEISKLEALLAENPEDIHILDWVAFTHYSNQNFKRSIELYKQLLEKEPTTASFYYFIANSYYREGFYDEAKTSWTKAIELDVKGKFSKKARQRLEWLEMNEVPE
jgi:tetratricopeptide (TPR) repeat protein